MVGISFFLPRSTNCYEVEAFSFPFFFSNPCSLVSWGEEYQKGKTTEVAEGESKIKELTSQVEELNASAACLG